MDKVRPLDLIEQWLVDNAEWLLEIKVGASRWGSSIDIYSALNQSVGIISHQKETNTIEVYHHDPDVKPNRYKCSLSDPNLFSWLKHQIEALSEIHLLNYDIWDDR